MEAAFGAGSAIYTQTTERLSRIFADSKHAPPVAARLREWRSRQHAPSADEPSFLYQTYLALLARLVARRFVVPSRPVFGSEELLEVINTDYFSRRGIGNYGEGDIFSWFPFEPRWGLGLDDQVLETAQALGDALDSYDFSAASPGIMDALYRPTVPRWLSEYVAEVELGLAGGPGLSLLDPACGTGTFLCAAISAMKKCVEQQGGDAFNVLFDAPQLVRGMDSDPLAVALARLNYLLALGGLVQQEHPPILLPVYLADAEAARPRSTDDGLVLSTTAGEYPLPAPFIADPMNLDWILGRLTNYMDGAQLRLHVQSEEEAVQEVLNAYYNYLTAEKPRTPVPDPLTPRDADIVLDTARRLVQLHIGGEGTLWLHLVQNMAAPTVFANRGYDRLAGEGPVDSFQTLSGIYLKQGGKTAVVSAWSEESARVVTHSGQSVSLRSSGGPIPRDSSWADAKADVEVVEA